MLSSLSMHNERQLLRALIRQKGGGWWVFIGNSCVLMLIERTVGALKESIILSLVEHVKV